MTIPKRYLNNDRENSHIRRLQSTQHISLTNFPSSKVEDQSYNKQHSKIIKLSDYFLPTILDDLNPKVPAIQDIWETIFNMLPLEDVISSRKTCKTFFMYSISGIIQQTKYLSPTNEMSIKVHYYFIRRCLLENYYIEGKKLNQNIMVHTHQNANFPFNEIISFLNEKTERVELSKLLITDEDIETLAKRCPNITRLDISECQNITDRSLVCIQTNFVNLKYFNSAVKILHLKVMTVYYAFDLDS